MTQILDKIIEIERENEGFSENESNPNIVQDCIFYLLQVEGDPNFKLLGKSAREGGKKAEFTSAGWVYQKKEEAEAVAKRWSVGKRRIKVVPWFEPILRTVWNGSKEESKAAKKRIRLEFKRHAHNEKRKHIETHCHQEGLHWSWLHGDAPANDMSDQEKKVFAYYKPLWDEAGKEQEEIELRESDLAMEEEDLKSSDLPTIEIEPGKLHEAVSKAENVLISKNVGIFQRGGQLVRIIAEKSKAKKKNLVERAADSLVLAEVDSIYLAEVLGKQANWTRYDERTEEWVLRDCPDRVAKTLICRRQWNIPILSGIIQAPTLRSDGSILEKPGYDEETGLFFDPGSTRFETVPEQPSKDDALSALEILKDLLKGFPFENDESESVAISGILTGLIRKSIRTAPAHAIDAPKMASGKTLLADVVGLVATGKSNSVIPQSENEAEEKKRLLAVLAEGDPIVCYDNIERPFGSAALCSVLTQERFKDRLLGQSRSLSVPTNATFLVTGNNLVFVGDTSTRVILCRLDPKCERPEERFFDTDLRQTIPENRSELVIAALTILRAYHVAGRPEQDIRQFGRFEEWSNWVRSSLVWLGMADPCKSRKEIENADPVRKSLGAALQSLYEYWGNLSFRISEIIKKAEGETDESKKAQAEAVLDSLSQLASDDRSKLNARSLGKKFSQYKGRIENGYRLERTGSYQGIDTWRVVKN